MKSLSAHARLPELVKNPSTIPSVEIGETLIFTAFNNEKSSTFKVSVKINQLIDSDKIKEIFIGELEHNQMRVYIKIFKKPFETAHHVISKSSLFIPIDIYEPITKKGNDGIITNHIVEVSLAGKALRIGNVSMENKLEMIKQLLFELYYIHSIYKCIHNDIKPSNIIVFEYGGDDKKTFHFIDFEMAFFFDSEDGNYAYSNGYRHVSKAGTPHYNAPEKTNDITSFIHPKSDIFSLGMVFIEIILGHLISNDTNSINNSLLECQIICKEYHENLHNMLTKMLNPIRKERPTCVECLEMLDSNPDQFELNDFSNLYTPSTTLIESLNADEQITNKDDLVVSLDDESSSCCHCSKQSKCATKRCPCHAKKHFL